MNPFVGRQMVWRKPRWADLKPGTRVRIADISKAIGLPKKALTKSAGELVSAFSGLGVTWKYGVVDNLASGIEFDNGGYLEFGRRRGVRVVKLVSMEAYMVDRVSQADYLASKRLRSFQGESNLAEGA